MVLALLSLTLAVVTYIYWPYHVCFLASLM